MAILPQNPEISGSLLSNDPASIFFPERANRGVSCYPAQVEFRDLLSLYLLTATRFPTGRLIIDLHALHCRGSTWRGDGFCCVSPGFRL